jgi:hypothetical protein
MATAYSGTKMALEVVRESSDVFVPLKSVVGGLSAFLKQYDVSDLQITLPRLILDVISKQYISNKDDVQRLIQRIQTLSTLLKRSPTKKDTTEIERRTDLKKLHQ